MDPGGAGGLIGIGMLACMFVSVYIYDKCYKKKNVTEHTHLLEVSTSIPVQTTENPSNILQNPVYKKQSSMRDFFDKNTQPNALKVIRIS